jgi:tetratricopeptide (TPR) repeat protein
LQARFITWLANQGVSRFEVATLDALCLQAQEQLGQRFAPPPRPMNMPYPSLGTLFKGRETFLADLRASLTSGGATAIATAANAAIHGLGGIGKTRAAVEYAYAHQADYEALLFVPAETPDALTTNLAALTDLLGMPEMAEQTPDRRCVAVIAWLNRFPGWLLILDNVDTDAALIAAATLRGQLRVGHVLLTSRQSNLPDGFDSLEMDVLSVHAATAYLLERTEGRRRPAPDDPAQAEALAQALGRLALGLTHAAAFVRRRPCTLADYRARLARVPAEVLRFSDPVVTRDPRSILATLALSVEQLTPAGQQLLAVLSFLATAPVPDALVEALGDQGDPVRDALADLTAYSLVTQDPEAPQFAVHWLVQTVTRTGLDPEAAKAALTAALAWVDGAFQGDSGDVRTWPRLLPLAAHAEAVATHGQEAAIDEPTGRLLNALGEMFRTQARFPAAERLMRAALDINEKARGPNDPVVATCLNNLAALLQATNRLAEAEPLFRRVVTIFEASLGSENPLVATAVNNIGSMLRAMNRLGEAELLFRRALAIDEVSLGPKHPDVARGLNNLASLLRATNQPAEAELLFRRALAIDEASLGPEHPSVAIDLNNLAGLLQDTNRLAEAEPLYRRALAIDEASLGPEHPDVARDLNNLAALLYATNRLAEAEPLFRRALAISEASLGPEHPDVAIRLNSLASLLQATNRLAEAEPLFRRALAIDEASLGPEHPFVARDLNNLAALLYDTNRLAEAEPLFRRMVVIFLKFQAATGHAHPHRDTALNNHATLLQALGRTRAEIIAEFQAMLAEAGLQGF